MNRGESFLFMGHNHNVVVDVDRSLLQNQLLGLEYKSKAGVALAARHTRFCESKPCVVRINGP